MHPYVHHVPGRLRIRSTELRRFPDRAACVQEALTDIEGIDSVVFNEHAASITVHYRQDAVDTDTILNLLTNHGCLAPVDATVLKPRLEEKAGSLFGKAFFAVLLERALERSVLSFVTALR